jgi:general secretion pathway protein I
MNKEHGFTLVEMLVALAILTIALAVLFGAISDSLDRVKRAKDEAVAASLAQSLLARADAANPMRAGDASGTYTNGFHWRLVVKRYGNADDTKAWKMSAYAIRATVSYPHGDRTLSALRLVAPEKPLP